MDASFSGGMAGNAPNMSGGAPAEAVSACVGLTQGADCNFIGTMNLERMGTCEMRMGRLVCVP